jgi:hypothetical protein
MDRERPMNEVPRSGMVMGNELNEETDGGVRDASRLNF